jgi:putative ABC transport system permease protein
MTLATIILKNISYKKVRTAFTVLGVGVSIAAYVALTGITRELEKTLKTTYDSRGTDLIVMEKGIVDILSSSIDENSKEMIKKLPGVEDVSAILFGFYAFNIKQYMMIYGWEKGSYLFDEIKLSGAKPERPDEAILGAFAAKRLNKRIGDTLSIKGESFKITGIYQSKSLLEDGAAVIDIKKLQEIKKTPGKVTAYNIKVQTRSGDTGVESERKVSRAGEAIEALLPDVEVKNVRQFMSSNTPLFIIFGFTWAVSVVALLIVLLGIVNTMTTSVLERAREIGILRAIGWPGERIACMVLCESVLLSVFGGIVGTAGGYGIMTILSSRPQLEGFMAVRFDPVFILSVIGVSALLGILSGIYPAAKAISVDPIKVLRYE